MKNKEKIEYTYKHRKIVMFLGEKYFPDNKELLEKLKLHDLDKLYLYLFYDKKNVSKLHRDLSCHHENDLEKSYLDYVEMILDWESARYTKPDKPLNAYETLINFYPNMKDVLLPILESMGIASEKLPMEDDVLEYTKLVNDISYDTIKEDMKAYLDMLM